MTREPPDVLWPRYESPADIAEIERVPLADRGLPATTWDVLRRAANLWPHLPAMHVLPDGDRWQAPVTISYRDLADAASRTACLLDRFGVGRDDVVGILSPNTAELVPAMLGAQRAGIVAPVNPALRPDEVADLLRRARARVLVAAGPELHPALWEAARAVVTAVGARALFALRPTAPPGDAPALLPMAGVHVAYLDPFGDDVAPTAERDTPAEPDPPPAGDHLAAFFHTGGTTGTPKLAAHTHTMEVTDAWAVAAGLDTADGTAALAALPLFHVNALVVTLLAPLLTGRAVVWAGPLGYRDPGLLQNLWRIVEHYRIGCMSGVPTAYEALTRVPVDADLATLRLCIVGAAPLPPSVADRWLAHTGVALCEGYGLTEATCACARTLPGHGVAGSVGQRFPYQQIKAVSIDPAGEWHDLPPGGVGTLVIRGTVVFPGYLVGYDGARPVLDGVGTLREGWLDTGDLGSVDASGFVRLTGRAKDLIIRGGHNIDPADVEAALRCHPRVRDAAAVGRPDRRSGEVPVAYVVADSDDPLDEAELLAWAAAHVSEPAAAPKSVHVVQALPVTAIGKPHKVPLREDAARRELGPRLHALGIFGAEDGSWCREVDGRITVTLSVSAVATARTIVDEYAVTVIIDGATGRSTPVGSDTAYT